MTEPDKTVAVGLLAEKELRQFGSDLKRIYPVPADGNFEDLLRRIEKAGKTRR